MQPDGTGSAVKTSRAWQTRTPLAGVGVEGLSGVEDFTTGNGHFPLFKPDESDFERLHGDALLGHHLKLLDLRYGGYEAEHLETPDGFARLDPSSLDRRRRLAWRLLRRRGWVTTLATGRGGYPVSRDTKTRRPACSRKAVWGALRLGAELAAGPLCSRQSGQASLDRKGWLLRGANSGRARDGTAAGCLVSSSKSETLGVRGHPCAEGAAARRKPKRVPRCIPLPCQLHLGLDPGRRDRREDRRRSWVPNRSHCAGVP